MTPEERRRHELVIMGFFHAILPAESWPSFPAYIDHLATSNPIALRDHMLEFCGRIPPKAGDSDCEHDEEAPRVDLATVLKDEEAYLDFLRSRFDADYLDEELEAQAYSFVANPAAMQDLIVTHLRKSSIPPSEAAECHRVSCGAAVYRRWSFARICWSRQRGTGRQGWQLEESWVGKYESLVLPHLGV